MESILSHIRELRDYEHFSDQIKNDRSLYPITVPRSFRLPLLASLYHELNRPIVIVSDRFDHASRLFDEMGAWLPNSPCYLFSEPTPLFYEDATWDLSIRQERLRVLTLLSSYNIPFAKKPVEPPIIFTSTRALMTRTIPRRDFIRNCKKLTINNQVNSESLFADLYRLGYINSDIVLEPGQVSKRGGILDIWVPSADQPFRIEFFDVEIESIRKFDHATQRTLETLDEILITPAREFIVPEQDHDQVSTPDDAREFNIPLYHKAIESLVDHLPKRSLVFLIDPHMIEGNSNEIEEQAIKLRNELVTDGLLDEKFPVPYMAWGEIYDSMDSLTVYKFSHEVEGTPEEYFQDVLSHDERFAGKLKPFVAYLFEKVMAGDEVVLTSRQYERLQELWREHIHGLNLSPTELELLEHNLRFHALEITEGFKLRTSRGDLHLITDSEIFGWEKVHSRKVRNVQFQGSPEAIYGDLKIGDAVVHVDYGIGKFTGMVKRMLDNYEREYIVVEYKGGDQLFVPIFQADRITRYISTDGTAASATRLGTPEWTNAKANVKEAVKKVAEDLLQLYAQRQTVNGYTFQPDTVWQKELEDSFPFVETKDQLTALADIKKDMESARPMDRLLCGDVGYGKTEVALRAAFKAIQDGKQVAVLVPTTVLALQHFETFRQRLAAFPVTIEMLSRFKTAHEQDAIIKRLSEGSVDIVIGTHRLMSQDVSFKDLGLVIIDEEQRFGVTHKEHLKNLRVEVDVLTLTATPIPRTLYMALSGVRDISNLNSPPEERLPVVTHIGPYSPKVARQAILRELERGGQIFFVHNRVQTIYSMKMHLEKLVPEAKIGIGHGQMDEKELEKVMHNFTDGSIDLLLSTTIIESGLDIPNANTLIIDRADTFGLAQLYQLRGRVGRAANRAYAYFFRHRKRLPTLEGQERLDVLAENTHLGAGYSIAMRDLEIRGAGELLGMRQSGHIVSVGFHLYTRMLSTAVKRLKNAMKSLATEQGIEHPLHLDENNPLFEEELKEPVTVELPLAIGLPSAYIPKQEMRLRIYRRIASMRDEEELIPLAMEFEDRFGPMPEMCKNLFFQMRIKLMADAVGIASVSVENNQVVLKYHNISDTITNRVLRDLSPIIRGGKNAYWCNIMKSEDWQKELIEILISLKLRTITL